MQKKAVLFIILLTQNNVLHYREQHLSGGDVSLRLCSMWLILKCLGRAFKSQ